MSPGSKAKLMLATFAAVPAATQAATSVPARSVTGYWTMNGAGGFQETCAASTFTLDVTSAGTGALTAATFASSVSVLFGGNPLLSSSLGSAAVSGPVTGGAGQALFSV